MKKIMTIIAAAAVALTLVGCANFGDAKASGTKYKKTFSLDATGELKDADGNAATYSRAFSALSTSKKCSAIETTITLPKGEDNVFISDKDNPNTHKKYQAVVGLAFDVHLTKNDAGEDVYDFVLVGVKPGDGGYYIEKYTGVKKDDLKESMKTNEGSIGGTYTPVQGAAETNGWAGTLTLPTDGDTTWKISVTQETAGTYKVLINDVVKGTYTRELTDAEKADTKNGKAYGQIFLYANAPTGTKIKGTFESNKDKTVGLFADEE